MAPIEVGGQSAKTAPAPGTWERGFGSGLDRQPGAGKMAMSDVGDVRKPSHLWQSVENAVTRPDHHARDAYAEGVPELDKAPATVGTWRACNLGEVDKQIRDCDVG